MKILFLDIDGVVNSEETLKRSANGGIVGIDPYMAFLIGNMVDDLGLKVVLSSSWRHSEENVADIEKHICPILDKTPYLRGVRGIEIKDWLDRHPEVKKYAIIDDDSDMLPEQLPNFFKTEWQLGVTPEIIRKITQHFNETN